VTVYQEKDWKAGGLLSGKNISFYFKIRVREIEKLVKIVGISE
jgi:hypothetical protein